MIFSSHNLDASSSNLSTIQCMSQIEGGGGGGGGEGGGGERGLTVYILGGPMYFFGLEIYTPGFFFVSRNISCIF